MPTKELARQAQSMIQQLAAYCSRDIRVANVSAADDSASQRWVKAAALWRNEAARTCTVGLVCGKKEGWSGVRSKLDLLPSAEVLPPAELC